MNREKMYSLAIRKRANSDDFFWNHRQYLFNEIKLDSKGRYWFADPFLFEKGGKVYVFYEAYDLIQRKGKIGYSVINEKGGRLPIHIVLEKDYHLSFPYIFERDGEIYLMPETCEINAVHIFKSTSFPDKWEEGKNVISNIFSCDSIVIQDWHKNPYLLTCKMYRDPFPHGNYASCWVQNICYKMNETFETKGDGTLVAEGDCGIRNAGKSFYHAGKIYRIGQNCPDKQYGKGLVLFDVESLEPYKEKKLWIKNAEEFNSHIFKRKDHKIIGVHTYNFCDSYEIIDFSQIREWEISTLLIDRWRNKKKIAKTYLRRVKKAIKSIKP